MTLETLAQYGVERMDDEAVRAFLTTQNVGILGLPTADAPVLLPLSFGFDGESTLYFTFVLQGDSEKQARAEQAEAATFLVYQADTAFTWQSARLTGRIEPVPEDEVDAARDALANAWRPTLFEESTDGVDVELYRFVVADWSAIKQTGLPPGFDG
ncbi:pyridoxamine 5'-phosphate oxidase family protein [Haloarchaeobius sp. FL176]|uniref:pyridoxamine 5'-phosphate oxidase family protein n=1 Tax=Haloarchaeobius sp. FL176 TaxID=2967129 RepID=UPI002148BE41|nr:pyridoxamine 5'-phosphate oxidase family protein [Haloarchaeobius sp. FL176]